MKRIVLILALAPTLVALPRQPAVSRTHVAFVEAGQVWIVARSGGDAVRLTDSAGAKWSPRFSPDGSRIAFTSADLYTVPAAGGAATRVTYLPSNATLNQWTADNRLLFSTSAFSFSRIENQLFAVGAGGGLPVRMPVAYGTDGAVDATATWLAYTPKWPSPLISHWVGYRGGAAPDVWLVNLQSGARRNVTASDASDLNPMWHGSTLYYLSDDCPEQRRNIFAYDVARQVRRQVTHVRDYDLRNASIGPDAIVFEHGAAIELLDLRTEKTSEVRIRTPGVAQWREVDASRFITFSQPPLTEARGDLWIGGKNITNTSGVFEREAALSPDGGSIAYWSDRSGEYQLYVRGIGEAEGKPLTSYANGFRYRPVWSPDAKRLAFTDQSGGITVFDIAARRATSVDREPWSAGIDSIDLAWSADSTWLAYTKSASNRLTAIWRYELAGGARQQLTSDMFAAGTPTFDPKGENLFFISFRNFDNVSYDWIQDRLTHRGLAVLMQVPLRGTAFNVDAFESAATRVPTGSGSVATLAVSPEGNPKYTLVDLAGNRSTRSYDMAAHRETVVDEAAPKSESLPLRVDVRAEWRQIFDDAWRLYRDFLFAPNAPSVDWSAVKARYEPLLARCKSREEVNLVLAQMIGESRVGHAYMGRPGDVAPPARSDAATLGADFEVVDGGFRVTRILPGGPLDRTAAAGDVLRAVNGRPVDTTRDPRALLVDLAGKPVRLTIGAREIEVVPIASENDLRRREWVESNRRRVGEASGGRIGYVHIPDFTASGFSEFARQFYGQIAKEALVIDARWSSGGSIGAILAELLARKPLNFAAGRYNESWPAPRYGAHFGPKALLVNHITVSAGENFSYYFRKLGLGPIVGARTWGGLTGLNTVPSLIDGGGVNVPNAPFFDKSGWLIEGHGLEPDVVIEDDAEAQLDGAVKALMNALPASPSVSR